MINLRQNKGFALVFSLIFLFLIVSFMAVFILTVANGLAMANRTANQKKAYYVAEAGLADAYERITQAGINTIPSNVSFIPSPTTDNGLFAVGSGNGSYTVSLGYSNSPRTNYTITSTGTYGGMKKTLQLKIIGAAISKYAYWSETELNPAFGGPLWWVGEPGLEMLTTGPVQTNGQLNIFGNPIFYGAVTEADLPIVNGTLGTVPFADSPDYYSGVASDPNIIFTQGITDQAPAINLPPQPTLTAIQAVASDGQGLVLTGPSTIISKVTPSGTEELFVTGKVKNADGTVTSYTNTQMSLPANGVIYVQSDAGTQDGTATVQGTLSGQLTVAADQNIDISGSVAYNQDPRPTAANPAGYPNSQDLWSLVANQNITVIQASVADQAAANGTGPGLELAAVMVALQGSFQVDNYGAYMGPAGPPGNPNAAIMDQFGSLINYVCGATGEMDWSGNLLGGWNQVQTFDTRLATIAPPGFPPYISNTGAGVYSKYMNPQSFSEL